MTDGEIAERPEDFALQRDLRVIGENINARLVLVSDSRYDADAGGASGLKSKLESIPVNPDSSKQKIVDDIKTDLEIAAMIEKGGLAEVNRQMAVMLAKAKEGDTNSADNIDILLHRAICLFPHMAGGVEISIKSGMIERSGEITENYRDPNRAALEYFLSAIKSKFGIPMPNDFCVPLPYRFTQDTHGSAEREGVLNSRDEIKLVNMKFKGLSRLGQSDLGIAIGLQLSAFKDRSTQFLLSEVEGIRFVNNAQFTPLINPDIEGPEAELIDRGTPETYYLGFRGFKLASSAVLIEAGFYVSKSLWKEGMRRLDCGFIAEEADPRRVSLHEISNLEYPAHTQPSAEDVATIFLEELRKKGIGNVIGAITYSGRDIIRRLVRIPSGFTN